MKTRDEQASPVIKIFVSHRIDLDSETIDNPIYVPVRCGAVFDQENLSGLPGDDTGDHISDRRMTFNEFTVQYWAWKNVDADYYGLCHYRRYLSFSDAWFPVDEHNMIRVPILTRRAKERYGLLDEENMRRVISGHDIVAFEAAPVKHIPTPHGMKKTVGEMWEAHDEKFFKKSSIDLMFRLIDEMAPEYSVTAREYFAGELHRGYNCYVMKKELFQRLCAFQFPIMFELERRLDTTGYTETMRRTPAFIGEMLYGIFVYHVTTREGRSVKDLQLVYFIDARKIKGAIDLTWRLARIYGEQLLRMLVDPFFPKGSQRREWLKRVLHSVFHK